MADAYDLARGPYVAITKDTPLPTPEEARAWWDDYGMLDNIRRHSEVVCKVALLLTDWLAAAGLNFNRPAVEVGALAHDIAKTPCLGSEKLHFIEGEKILLALGYPELGFLVRRHVYLPPEHPLDETMIVNYADKRVTHDKIVDLNQRFDYIAERYGNGDPQRVARIKQGRQRAFAAEQSIFAPLGGLHQPEDIARLGLEVL